MKNLFIISSIVLLAACAQKNIKSVTVFETDSLKVGAGNLSVGDHVIATDKGNLKVRGLIRKAGTKMRSRKRVEAIKLKYITAIMPINWKDSEDDWKVSRVKPTESCGIQQKSFDRETMTTLLQQSCESVVNEMIKAVSNIEHVMINDNYYAADGYTCIHPKVMSNVGINQKGYSPKKMCVKTNDYLEYDQFIKTGLNDFIKKG